MKRHFLWILPAVALLSPAFALAQEAPKATVTDNLDVSVTTKKETEAVGRKTTETNTGSFSVNDKETVTPDGKNTSDHGREVSFEHKTETEISKGDHHEVKVSENDSIRANTDVSTDGDNGDTATVGVGYTKGYNADAETHAGADGKYAGGNVEADAHANAGLDADAQWTVGPDGIEGTADVRFGADAEAHAGADGRLGTEDYNVHAGADVKISAEAAAEIKARILAGKEGLGAEAEAKAGVSVGAEGVIKGGVTIWGIPFDIVLSGGVKAGAEASARGGIMYDAEKGTLTLEVGASAVAGVGAKGNIKVEIGVGKLFGKLLDKLFPSEDSKTTEEPQNDSNSGDNTCPVPGKSEHVDGSGGDNTCPVPEKDDQPSDNTCPVPDDSANPVPTPNVRDPDHPLAPHRIEGWEWWGTRSDRETQYNNMWDIGEDYATPPPPCKCGASCACYQANLAEWKSAYEDFKRKQESAYWALKVMRADGWVRRLKNTDTLLQDIPIPYFGTAYSLMRLAQDIPEVSQDIWKDHEVQQQQRDWEKWGTDVSQLSQNLGDFLDEMHEVEKILGKKLVENEEELRNVTNNREFLDDWAKSIRKAQEALQKEGVALSSEYPAPSEEVAKLMKKMEKLDKQAATIGRKATDLAQKQTKLAATGEKIAARLGKTHPNFAKSANFEKISTALSIGFLIYDVGIRTDDDSIRGRNRQRERLEQSYDEGEGNELFDALNHLSDVYNAGCECPDPKPPPEDPPITVCQPNMPDFGESDWRESHPIWAYILDNVLPEFIRIIFDILINHPDWTIENLLKFDENGYPIIHDGVPEFNPDLEIDEIPTHSLPQISEIPNQGTSDDDVYYGAKEANRKAEEALLTPPQCNCNESVVKLLELKNLIEQHKKAIEDFRLAHIAYAKSFDAIGDRLGDVFVDIGGNAVGALFGPHLKDIFCAATESLDIIGWATTGEYEISKLDLFWKVAEILVERFKEYYKKIKGDLPKEVVKLIGKELGERSIDIGLMFAKILVNIPITMYDVLTDWWDARNANDNAKEKLSELTNRLNSEVSIYLANEGCYCKPGCLCKHCLLKKKIVIQPPVDDPDDPWYGIYVGGGGGGGVQTPIEVLVDIGGGDDGGVIGGVPDLGSLIDGIGGGIINTGGISIPDFGISGSDSPIIPDSIGNPTIVITASGILNTGSVNSKKGQAGVVVDGNKGGAAPKRNTGDIGGKGQSQIWSNKK